VLFERVSLLEDVGMERLNLDAGDKKRGTGHMTVGVHGVQWVLKAAVKTAENGVLVPEHRVRVETPLRFQDDEMANDEEIVTSL
jgi:hypothetical protein